jgi:hypothetical protein
VEIPFLREIVQIFTAAAVHLGLRLAFASGLPYEATAVILEVVDVCAHLCSSVLNPDESALNG